jgi:hypothetical protein
MFSRISNRKSGSNGYDSLRYNISPLNLVFPPSTKELNYAPLIDLRYFIKKLIKYKAVSFSEIHVLCAWEGQFQT